LRSRVFLEVSETNALHCRCTLNSSRRKQLRQKRRQIYASSKQ